MGQLRFLDPRTPITLTYAGASQMVSSDKDGKLALFSNTRRAPVQADARVKDPLTLREALSCLYEVVSSDFRYVPRDKTAYLAYMRLRKSMAGQSAWQAQQAYFAPDETVLAPESGVVEHLLYIRQGIVTGRRGLADQAGGFQYEAGDLFPVGAVMGARAVTATYQAAEDTS